MTRPVNLFHRLVKDENSMTELFCNLLAYKPFRDRFLDLLCLNLGAVIEYEHCNTQERLENNGQPDLIIDDEKAVIIIVEIKTGNSGLTENQPNGYLEHLKKCSHKEKWLVLLAPEDYAHRAGWEDKIKEKVSFGIETTIVTWKNIFSLLKYHDLPDLSQGFKDFYGLLESWFFQQIYFASQEVQIMFKNEIPSIIVKLLKIVDSVCSELGGKVTWERNKDVNAYGAYFKNKKGETLLWFGIWFDFWEEHGKPLCYTIEENSSKAEEFSGRHKDRIKNFKLHNVSWIEQNIFSNDHGSSAEICRILEEELAVLGWKEN